MSGLSELLADCEARGIQLLPTDDGGLTIDAPQEAMTPDLIDRLKAGKGELLVMLRPIAETGQAKAAAMSVAPTTPAKAVCRCGSTTWKEAPIHGGRSIRRDCAGCGRFLDFALWHGN